MSSPSPSSSSHSIPDDSTKERRRERNRLAAQKHRLRRTQRMSQLEEQVLALQKEKHALVSQLNPPHRDLNSPPWDDHAPQRKRPRTLSRAAITSTQDPPDDVVTDTGYVSRLEDRIIELERWTEDLNGSLQDALDSEARLKADLHAQIARTDSQSRQFHDTIRAYDVERERKQHEIDMLKRQIADDARTELDNDESRHQKVISDLRSQNTTLKEMLEGAEVALELQRRENDLLRDRLSSSSSLSKAEAERASSDLRDAEDDARWQRKCRADAEVKWAEKLEAAQQEHKEKLLALQDENQRLTESLNVESRSARQLSSAKSKLTRMESENSRLREMMGSYEQKLESLEHAVEQHSTDHDALAEENAKLRQELDASHETSTAASAERLKAEEDGDHIRDLARQLREQHADAEAQACEWREKLAEAEREKTQLSEKVSSLLGALEKVRDFLTSKGIPIDLD
ncbi:hypothetical protein BD410DRAFT_798803 [Rickenella mellea]|uniref:BZIP domain-containing protein n=1 Tax=Rickenella mellea TaxID=50990 RepID=A0A4Y7QNW8_9AGAM|nr:hypothetical protein BD410DRAFT_798803 [Rickenella mellea]